MLVGVKPTVGYCAERSATGEGALALAAMEVRVCDAGKTSLVRPAGPVAAPEKPSGGSRALATLAGVPEWELTYPGVIS